MGRINMICLNIKFVHKGAQFDKYKWKIVSHLVFIVKADPQVRRLREPKFCALKK